MTYDLLLTGGTVVDGTGARRVRADIAVRDGVIVDIGELSSAEAGRTVDVSGLIVAPGIIDIHTHYDAQVCWDRELSGSAEHGVTTVVQGNCGIGIAPCRPDDRSTVINDLEALEGIPNADMVAGITWEFETFPEYLDMMRRKGIGVNVVALAPLSTFRRYVLRDEASDRAATPEEREAIAGNIRDAVLAGAAGFSSSMVRRQFAADGRPLPGSLADDEELKAYSNVLRDLDRGTIQVNVIDQLSRPQEDELSVLDLLLRESGRRIAYSMAGDRNDDPSALDDMLEKVEPYRQRGAYPQTMTRPMTGLMNFRSPMAFADLESFRELSGKDHDEQMAIYGDAGWRERARRDLSRPSINFGTWPDAVVSTVTNDALRPLIGLTIAEVAERRGADPFDTMIDLVLEDDLGLQVAAAVLNSNSERLQENICDPRVLIGLHDGGAHVDMMFETSYPTYMLGYWVREKQAMSLEQAIHRMTGEPAEFFSLQDRGRLAKGMAADLFVFDPATVGSPARPDEIRHDLPAGGMRYYAGAQGVSYVFVNGEQIYDHGRHTGALPGRIVS